MNNAHRRLLDLLAGWTYYAAKCAESDDPNDKTPREEYDRESDWIYDLYQEVGRAEELSEVDIVVAMRRIEMFVRNGALTAGSTG